jgi:hypothetical protein
MIQHLLARPLEKPILFSPSKGFVGGAGTNGAIGVAICPDLDYIQI